MFFANSLRSTLFLLLFAIICITIGCGLISSSSVFGNHCKPYSFCFFCGYSSEFINIRHIIVVKFVKIIVVIKIDDWANRSRHCTVGLHVLYYLFKAGGSKSIYIFIKIT